MKAGLLKLLADMTLAGGGEAREKKQISGSHLRGSESVALGKGSETAL